MYGINHDGKKVLPEPHTYAKCPGCDEELIPKCGLIKVWHWSHKSNSECDEWYESEGPWHRSWKDDIKSEFCEVKVGNHRADIKNKFGMVIELQNSSISAETIEEREEHYGKMIWVINGENFEHNFNLRQKDGNSNYATFRWKHPRKCWQYADCPIFIDFGDRMFQIKKFYWDGAWSACSGWGFYKDYDEFEEFYFRGIKKDVEKMEGQ